jgi:hypothetical protein
MLPCAMGSELEGRRESSRRRRAGGGRSRAGVWRSGESGRWPEWRGRTQRLESRRPTVSGRARWRIEQGRAQRRVAGGQGRKEEERRRRGSA